LQTQTSKGHSTKCTKNAGNAFHLQLFVNTTSGEQTFTSLEFQLLSIFAGEHNTDQIARPRTSV